MLTNSIRETLAAAQHAIWSKWMKYLFSKGTYNDDGTWTMPEDLVDRWTRQLNTDYDLLSEPEKDSDRHQADKILSAIFHEDIPKVMSSSARTKAYQSHHDHYIRRFLNTKATTVDIGQFRLAMLREGLGIVNPIDPQSES